MPRPHARHTHDISPRTVGPEGDAGVSLRQDPEHGGVAPRSGERVMRRDPESREAVFRAEMPRSDEGSDQVAQQRHGRPVNAVNAAGAGACSGPQQMKGVLNQGEEDADQDDRDAELISDASLGLFSAQARRDRGAGAEQGGCVGAPTRRSRRRRGRRTPGKPSGRNLARGPATLQVRRLGPDRRRRRGVCGGRVSRGDRRHDRPEVAERPPGAPAHPEEACPEDDRSGE